MLADIHVRRRTTCSCAGLVVLLLHARILVAHAGKLCMPCRSSELQRLQIKVCLVLLAAEIPEFLTCASSGQ